MSCVFSVTRLTDAIKMMFCCFLVKYHSVVCCRRIMVRLFPSGVGKIAKKAV